MSEERAEYQVATVASAAVMSVKGIADRVNLVHQVMKGVMHEGTHFGKVPGCGAKMVLLKPGADVLAMTFRLSPSYTVQKEDMGGGHREYTVHCIMRGPDGSIVAEGVGSGSTMERKYRYRKDQSGRTVENADIADVYNTVLKMSKKRAHIDATLTATGAADMFTQDLIEDDGLPGVVPSAIVTAETLAQLKSAIAESGKDESKILAFAKAGSLESMSQDMAVKVLAMIAKQKAGAA
jgi:hypothetical protein